MSLFRPPVVRSAAGVLDRALFSKTISISAARLMNNKIISKCRSQLTKSKEMLLEDRVAPIRSDPDPEFAAKGGKCLLLNPKVKHDGIVPQISQRVQNGILILFGRSYHLESNFTRSCKGTGVGSHPI